jgi:hypothetical protein
MILRVCDDPDNVSQYVIKIFYDSGGNHYASAMTVPKDQAHSLGTFSVLFEAMRKGFMRSLLKGVREESPPAEPEESPPAEPEKPKSPEAVLKEFGADMEEKLGELGEAVNKAIVDMTPGRR